MTTKFSNNSFISRMSYKNLNSIGRYVAMIAAVLFLALPQAWGATTYAKLTTSASPAAGGTAYCVLGSTFSGTATSATGQGKSSWGLFSGTTYSEVTFSINATPNAGYKFNGWTQGSNINSVTSTTAASTTLTMKPTSTKSGTPTAGTMTANFIAVTVNNVEPTSIDIAPTSPTQNYTGSIDFTTSNVNLSGLGDFDYSPTTDGKFTVTWARTNDDVKASYSFTGGGSYGGLSRNNTTTVSLQSKASGSIAKTCTITANFPNAKILDGSADELYTTFKAADATQTGVQKTAVFDVEYVDGTNNFDTPSITGANASMFTYNFMSYADGKLTVTYTYNGNKTAGDHTATLTLKVNDAIGGMDATYGSKSVTLTAHNEEEADYDVEVYNASGTKISDNTTMWADGLTLANSNAGSTIKLMRNIDLGTLTATQSVTNNITLDLNGKTLSGTISSSYPRLLYMNSANKTLTIMDSKTGGKLSATGSYTSALYCIQINNGNVILESGTIEIENTNTSQTTANRLYATGVYVKEGKTFTMNGGKIISTRHARDAYGVYVNATKAARGIATINGGEIYSYGNTYAYGIRGYGEININGGTVHAETLTGAAAYAVWLRATANAAVTETLYSGILNMTGGTLEALSKTSSAYGVYSEGTQAASTDAVIVDGTLSNKAAGFVNITGGTINATSTTTTAVGVFLLGDYNSKDDSHVTSIIKNATINANATTGTAYGIQCNATATAATGGLLQSDVELTNATVNARTVTSGNTAYAVYIQTAQVTGTGANNAGEEYATGSKAVINSGTYTATTIGTTAYAICAGQRAITFNEGAEGFATLVIHGGSFNANAGTSGARAVHSGGYTTIDGGEFHSTAGTTTAYGFFVNTGKLTASGVTVTAEANGTACGCVLEGNITNYDGVKAGIKNCGEMELNNLDVTATTRTSTEARGVYAIGGYRTLTQATFDGLSDANKTKYDLTYVKQDGVNRGGSWVCAGKLTINGGIYRATAATTTAYGVLINRTAYTNTATDFADVEATIKNAEFIVRTNGTTTATGIYTGGITTIDGCTIDVQPKSTTGYGVRAFNTTTVKNSTIDVTVTATGYGIQSEVQLCTKVESVYGALGKESIGKVISENNNVTVTATGGNTSYAIFANATKGNTASGPLAGDHALAGEAIVNGGKYTATASGTTAYAAGVAGPVLQGEATATPTLIINDGKFKGTATSTYADVSPAGESGYFVLNGGYYVKDENLDVKLGEGMNKVAVKSGTPEYTEGYRWRVTDNMTGEYVCKIKENSTSYASLEEALQVVNATPNSTWTIIMIANYTLSKGDYVLPAKTTLLIPYQSSQTTINGATPAWVTTKGTVIPFKKLTFASGVNMTVFGKIEASSTTYIVSSTQTAIVGGPYGQLDLNEGSYIDLENGAFLYAWGYVTGEGTINAKNGSTMYEDFQMGDWHGGGVGYSMNGNKNSANGKGTFMLNYYYFQNIESTVIYRPGSKAIAYSGTVISDIEAHSDPVNMVGTSDAMFLMDPATAGENTWVKKKYDPETDKIIWTLNSGASIGSVKLKVQVSVFLIGNIGVDMDSKDYVLPITSNFVIIANEGDINISNDVAFLPGVEVVVKKEANLIIPANQYVYIYDQDDWSQSTTNNNVYFYTLGYSPSWKTNPRSIGKTATTKLPDAKIQVEGTLTINGKLFTTASGANVCSTRENAGKVIFNSAVPSSVTSTATTTSKNGITNTLCQLTAYSGSSTSTSCTYTAKSINPVWLKNEDGTYSKPTSANTSAGDTWVYMQSLTSDTYEWTKASEDGCFTIRSTGDTKTYVHPSDWVAVGAVNANHAYPSEDATRMFVNTEAATSSKSCVWWEVNPTPEVIDGTTYYVANNENFDNFGTYYYWDNTTSYWKPKKITVTWRNEDGTKITNGTYGDEYSFNTSPQFFGTNPKKTPTAIEKYDWIGWRDADGNIYDKNATLPRATSDVTYTAYFNTTKYQYTITFKNDDNSDLWAGLVDAGTTGAELQALFETKYNEKTGSTIPLKASSVDRVYTFSSWNTSLATVTAAATYTANYTWVTRKYHVTFYNYDAVSVLYEADVNYNTNPVYPDDAVTPFRANTSAYSYNWTGWQQGATTYTTSATLPVVTGDIYYIATFEQTELQYQVFFKRQDGTIIDAPKFSYEETPSAFPANPTMASTVSTDYTFREWSPAELVSVTEDGMVYTALFDESPRQYTAHFVNFNGVSLNTDQTIDYNTVPTYTGADPMKPNDSRNSYEFSGWAWAAGDGWEAGSIGVGEALPAIKGNITFTAQYTPTLLQFDVIYQREDGFVILRDKKKWGESSAFPTTYAGATSGLNYQDETYDYTFDHWDPATVVNPVTADATYTAHFNAVSKETGFYVDIVDVDNSDNSAKKLTLNVTGWANAGWPYTINETEYIRDTHRAADRTMKIPYTGSAGENFTIAVKDKDDNVISLHTYTIPQEITSATTLTANQTMPIFVKGTTLTINGDISAQKIYVAPDAKLVVNSGKTLTADAVFLRTTPESAAELVYDGTIVGDVYYTRIIKSKSGYFQFGLPLSCTQTANDVRLSDGANPKYATSSGWILRYYDESSRAEKGVGDNWKTLGGTASVAAGKGYEMYSGVNYYREFYFPVDLTALTDKVAVSYTAGSQAVNNGWNVIVSPLTSTYTNDPAPEGMTVSWMQLDGTFEQEPMTTIAPAKTFAYQTSKNGYISFASSVAAEVAAAPRRRLPAAEEPERIQWIHLDILNADGEGDQTSIYSHPTRYEQTYKTGIDVAKQSFTASRAIIYSSHAYGDMAFAGVADTLLESGVSLTVYSPATQELTFSLRDNDWLNRMEHVWLIDNETGAKIDLLSSDYSYEAAEGTTRGRFFIQGQFKAPQITTDIQNGQSGEVQTTKARKLMINQKIFIEINGRLYDATGKEVKR